ncbi:MAG: hypothetical protein LBF43_00875 [Puniceicoccales bacterium]|jgi:hypothetical protein|nr:hypothetical protein [Puniceicoccales bacterium]
MLRCLGVSVSRCLGVSVSRCLGVSVSRCLGVFTVKLLYLPYLPLSRVFHGFSEVFGENSAVQCNGQGMFILRQGCWLRTEINGSKLLLGYLENFPSLAASVLKKTVDSTMLRLATRDCDRRKLRRVEAWGTSRSNGTQRNACH